MIESQTIGIFEYRTGIAALSGYIGLLLPILRRSLWISSIRLDGCKLHRTYLPHTTCQNHQSVIYSFIIYIQYTIPSHEDLKRLFSVCFVR